MRYEVKTEQTDWRVNSGLSYYVADTLGQTSPIGYHHESACAELTEAEANIIAFALNAVADGHQIAKTPGRFPRSTTMYGEVYDGPTEGVAP